MKEKLEQIRIDLESSIYASGDPEVGEDFYIGELAFEEAVAEIRELPVQFSHEQKLELGIEIVAAIRAISYDWDIVCPEDPKAAECFNSGQNLLHKQALFVAEAALRKIKEVKE